MSSELASAYRNKKVLVTGHTGFKGTWMSIWLDMLGAKVLGYSLIPKRGSLYPKISNRLGNHESIIADVRDGKSLKKALLEFQPDFIFHMAAQALVRESYRIPVDTFDVNVMGTVHLLDAVRSLKKKCAVVIITTDKVYKNTESGKPFLEDDSLGGHDPYSSSKAAAEVVTDSYRLSFFHSELHKQHKKSIATARAGNVIGGGDYSLDRIVPDIFRALSKSESVKVRNPDAIRPWQHVLEPISGYLALGKAMMEDPAGHSTSYNFGPFKKDALRVVELVEQAIKCWGGGKYAVTRLTNSPHEAGILRLDIRKAKSELGWEPTWNSEIAIDKTIQWYKSSVQKNADLLALCQNDIQAFVE